jgi:PEP-CTERM motif
MKRLSVIRGLTSAAAVAVVTASAIPAMATTFAVWLDGNTDPSCGGSGICTSLTDAFGAGSFNLVSTPQLDTPGFLSSNGYSAVIVSRFDSNFGTSLSATAAANIAAYVGSGPGQGGVAVFTNDASDNFLGATTGDVFDANLNRLFVNAAQNVALSGHGFIGEFNGAVMAMASNSAGFSVIGLLPGNASATRSFGPAFVYNVGPIGSGNPIDAGVTFPFTDGDTTTFLTDITGANPNNIVDIYTSPGINGEPAVLANSFAINPGVPEPATWAMMLLGFAGLGFAFRRSKRKVSFA